RPERGLEGSQDEATLAAGQELRQRFGEPARVPGRLRDDADELRVAAGRALQVFAELGERAGGDALGGLRVREAVGELGRAIARVLELLLELLAFALELHQEGAVFIGCRQPP